MIRITSTVEAFDAGSVGQQQYDKATIVEIPDDATTEQAIKGFIEVLRSESYLPISIYNSLRKCAKDLKQDAVSEVAEFTK